MSLSAVYAKNSKQKDSNTSVLEYQEASSFTHLAWPNPMAPAITIAIAPTINRSGIPMQDRDEDVNYYSHGNIPKSIDSLFTDLVNSSQYLKSVEHAEDYRLQLTINRYQLPFKHTPDDTWLQSLHDQVDRWLITAKNARVSISLQLTTGKKHIATWNKSISVALASCDLNVSPQALTSKNNYNKRLKTFTQSTSGQAFVAASNYLILQAIHYINDNASIARVEKVNNNELLLVADNANFMLGEKLPIYHNNQYSSQSRLPAGNVQIIKRFENQALAYPVDLKMESIKKGDWIQLTQQYSYPEPRTIFEPASRCGQIESAATVADATRL